MLPLLVAASGIRGPHAPGWPTLPRLYRDRTRAHTDPGCGALVGELVPAGGPTGAAGSLDPTPPRCSRCLDPELARLARHVAADEMDEAGTALADAIDAVYWTSVTFDDRNLPADIRTMIADPDRGPEAYNALTERTVVHVDIIDAIAHGLTCAQRARAGFHHVPIRLRAPWVDRLDAAEAALRHDLGLLRGVLDDDALAALAGRVLDSAGEPVTGQCWYFCDGTGVTDVDNVAARLELLWPRCVIWNRERTRIAAHIPAAYALAWVTGDQGELLLPTDTPTTRCRGNRLPHSRVDHIDMTTVGTDVIATALDLWQPPTAATRSSMDAATAVAVAHGIHLAGD